MRYQLMSPPSVVACSITVLPWASNADTCTAAMHVFPVPVIATYRQPEPQLASICVYNIHLAKADRDGEHTESSHVDVYTTQTARENKMDFICRQNPLPSAYTNLMIISVKN